MLTRKSVSLRLVSAVTAAAVALSPAAAGPALLFDATSGRVLYAEDPDAQWYPASLTKIMTAYLVFEALKNGKLDLEDKITVSELAHSQPPSRLGLPVGAQITVGTALTAVIVKSANDASVMLAEAVAGSHEAFVEQMNAAAKRLGMTRTRFINANGLPAPEQITTARDLARLTIAVVQEYPAYAHLWAMPEMKMGKRRMRNHNPLLRTYEGADGMKTGFICDAGFNIVASATRDGQRLFAVVLGETTGKERSERAANLLEHGFQTQGWKAMFGAPTLATLPADAEPKEASSIRSSVISWACGTGRRLVRGKHRRTRASVKRPTQKAAPDKGSAVKRPADKGAALEGPPRPINPVTELAKTKAPPSDKGGRP
jgi:D-alanyl-D-alanine carboxypeptidase